MKWPLPIISLFIIFLSGCTSMIHLGYTPAINKCETNNIALQVTTIDDQRTNKKTIGALRNLYGMPIVKIATNDNVPDWVTNALKLELSNAGYIIDEKGSDANYLIEGKLLHAFASTYFIYHGRMKIDISLKRDDNVIFHKVYATKKSHGVNWIVQTSICAKTLELNLQEVCKRFITDLNHKLLEGDLKIE
ncbi:MAG: hypothetical protein KR126chlam4_01063 [Candidatus Anoxychlamydiales bacterium]|nr:hypothetical protein [Candidatus Anoxychlamydiales bacterium]